MSTSVMSNETNVTVNSAVNNAESLEWDVSQYVYDLTYLLVFKIFGVTLSVFGIFGNVCTIIVLIPKKSKRNITIFIIALAVSDVSALFFFLVFCVFRILRDIVDPVGYINFIRIHYYYLNYIMRVPKNITNYFTLVIAIERLISVASPAAHRMSSSKPKKGAILLCVGISVMISVLFLPFALEFTYTTVYEEEKGRYIAYTVFTEFGSNRDFFFVYYIVINFLCTILAVVTTLICNIILVVFLFKRSKMTIGSTSTKAYSKREISTTKTLFLITCVFIICITPAAVYYPVRAMDIFKREALFNRVLFAWVNFSELVNHFANPLVFYFTSLEFRKAYQKLFLKNVVVPAETTAERGTISQQPRY